MKASGSEQVVLSRGTPKRAAPGKALDDADAGMRAKLLTAIDVDVDGDHRRCSHPPNHSLRGPN